MEFTIQLVMHQEKRNGYHLRRVLSFLLKMIKILVIWKLVGYLTKHLLYMKIAIVISYTLVIYLFSNLIKIFILIILNILVTIASFTLVVLVYLSKRLKSL